MDAENVKLISEGKRKERKFLRAAVITALIVAAFFIGFAIGYQVWSDRRDDGKNDSKTDDFRKRHEEIMNHHKNFQNDISQERLEKNLKFFTKTPHIAGSIRQKVIANELAKRWKDYGFDHVEMSEYKVLLSFPNTTNPSRITIKYSNGTIIHQVKAETQKLGKDVVPPFLAYSPSGNVEGELVYANYGRVKDFERLKNLSVNVTGKIAIMRYGIIFRGNKVQNAAMYGAIAALLYTDPAQYAQAGGDPNNTYPNTDWLPDDGVRRGSVLSIFGDPLTHGLPAIPGMYRRAINDSGTGLPPIPAYPMGYGDAFYFLSRMGGQEAPEDWKGGLDITYRLGPGFTENKITVSVEVNNHYKVKSIFDVIGTINGDVEPDRYVLVGNHYDAWVYGGVDPNSGTAVATEIARGLGRLKKAGWKPRRTIKICSWGAEEYGLLGSVEWVEQHEKLLSERAVIYLNLDMTVQGNSYMKVHSTPLVKDAIKDFSKTVHDPGAHDNKQTIFDIAAENDPSLPETDPPEPAVGDLGSGSDYAAFYQFVGVSSVDFRYTRQRSPNNSITYPLYHTRYDTFALVKKFLDPEFLYHKATAQFGGGLLLVYADSPLLNMNAMLYANALNETLDSLKRKYSDELKRHGPALGLLEGAIKTFHGAATNFTKAKEKLEKKLAAFDEPSFAELRRLNDRMMGIDRAFIYAYGLPGRRLVRNVFLANSKYDNYGSSRFPGINDALFQLKETGDKAEVDLQLSIAAQAVLSAVDILSGIA